MLPKIPPITAPARAVAQILVICISRGDILSEIYCPSLLPARPRVPPPNNAVAAGSTIIRTSPS